MEVAILIFQILILILLGSISYKLLPAYRNKKGENLATKEDIEEITIKIESVKAVFERDKIKFNSVYQKKVQVITEIHSKFHNCIMSLTTFLRMRFQPTTDPYIPDSEKILVDFADYLIKNKIYLDSPLYDSIYNLFREMSDIVQELVYLKPFNYLGDSYVAKWNEIQQKINTIFFKYEPIEKEFRNIVSGED